MLKKICLLIVSLLFYLLSFCQQNLSDFLQKDLTTTLLQRVDSLQDVLNQKNIAEDDANGTIADYKKAIKFVWFLQKLENGQQTGFTNTDSSFIEYFEFSDGKINNAVLVLDESTFSLLLEPSKNYVPDSIKILNCLSHFPKLQKSFIEGHLRIHLRVLDRSSAPAIKLPPPSMAGKGKSVLEKKRIMDEQMKSIKLQSEQHHCPTNLLGDYMKEEAKIPAADLDKKIESRNKFLAFIILNCH